MTRKARLLLNLIAFGFTASILGILVIIGAYFYFEPTLPDAEALKDIQLQVPLRVYTRDGVLLAEYGEQRRVPLALEEIPDAMEKAFLAAEDDRFYIHPGVDWQAILRAAINNLRAGEIVGGGSTITQQVAKNFFLSFEQVWSRKIREIFLAIKIEQQLGKDEILTLYLNKIYLGNRAYGVGAAAEIYYGKPVGELTLAEMAMIATLPKAPSRYNPLANPERALQRRAYVLGRMQELGYITEAEHALAMAAPNTAEYHGVVVELDAPYIGEMVRAEMLARYGNDAYTGGFHVHTTINAVQQRAAELAVRRALEEYDERYGYRGPIDRIDLEALEEEEWVARVREMPRPAALVPALVLDVADETAEVLNREGERIALTLDSIRWAAPALENRRTGPAPERMGDVLTVGDLVYLREVTDSGWRLAQVPEVQGALVSLNPDDGAIRALVGGYDFHASKFNRAVQAERQPGSSFKPFVYAAALANGYTPASIINDAPVVFADEKLEDVWRPENDSGRFYGPTRLREALVRSRNLVSIRIMQGMGIATAIDYLAKLGFERGKLPRDLSLALGSAAFSPMKMATEYAVLANGGFLVEPYFIERIENAEGRQLYVADPLRVCRECEAQHEESGPEDEMADFTQREYRADSPAVTRPWLLAADAPARRASRVMSAQVNYLIGDMMRDVIRRGTGARALELGRSDLSGKTGTTNEYRDAWFSGFNQRVATTVWVGFDDFTTLGSGEYGGRAALPAWIDFMRVALRGVPDELPERPTGLVSVRIDPQSGLVAQTGNPAAIFETFIDGTLPDVERDNAQQNDELDKNGDTSDEDLF